jgi:hypothetical protein
VQTQPILCSNEVELESGLYTKLEFASLAGVVKLGDYYSVMNIVEAPKFPSKKKSL